jgi:hypothetical protein
MRTQLSRREVLALLGSGATAAVAGCQSIDTISNQTTAGDEASPSRTESPEPTATETATPDATPTQTQTRTQTQTATQTPTVTPVQEYFRVERNDSRERIAVEFASPDRLQAFEIQITGAERTQLSQTDFEVEEISGGYVYAGGYNVTVEGTYTVSFARLVGSNIEEPPYSRERTVTFDLSAPVLESFRSTALSESELRMRLVADERLGAVSVDVRGVGGYREQFTRSDFTESRTGESYTYEATASVEQSGRYVLDLEYIEDRFQNRNELSERFYVAVE